MERARTKSSVKVAGKCLLVGIFIGLMNHCFLICSDVFPTTCVIEDNEVTDGMRRVQSTVAGLLANNNQDDCCLHQKCNLPVDDHSSTKVS